MGMMAYVLDLLYWSVIIENKFKRQDLQAYTYATTVFVQDLGFFNGCKCMNHGVNATIKQHLDSFATCQLV